MRSSLLLFAILYSASASANCLPELRIPPAYLECQADADCGVAGDGCRSCGTLIVVNRKFKAALEETDRKLRLDANCVQACEACSTAWAKPKCVQHRCKLPTREAGTP